MVREYLVTKQLEQAILEVLRINVLSASLGQGHLVVDITFVILQELLALFFPPLPLVLHFHRLQVAIISLPRLDCQSLLFDGFHFLRKLGEQFFLIHHLFNSAIVVFLEHLYVALCFQGNGLERFVRVGVALHLNLRLSHCLRLSVG